MSILQLLLTFLGALFKSQRQLALENLALRQQVAMLRQSVKQPRARHADKLFWIFFSRHVDGWRTLLHGLHPDTVVRWHRQGFRLYWRWKSRGQKPGRPVTDIALRKLIRKMQASNIGWGAPATARPESTENCSSWGLKYPGQQSRNTCCSQRSHHHKPGEHFSTTTQIAWRRWTSSPERRPPPHCQVSSALCIHRAKP